MKQYLLIDIGGTFIKYSLADEHAKKISGGKVPTPLTNMDDLLAVIEGFAAPLQGQFVGCAISMPGRIDTKHGIAHTGGVLSSFMWEQPFAAQVEARLGVPVTIASFCRAYSRISPVAEARPAQSGASANFSTLVRLKSSGSILATSVTMTIFYVVLYHIWRERYQIKGHKATTAAIYVLAGLRVILCMMPQNEWLSAEAPLSWGIYRNIPFALMGLLIIVLFYKSAKESNDQSFRWMWLTIILSFAFYIPVVLWADVVPMIGMLMIPKTCAYVWTVLIGYRAMKKEIA